jgi:hypothetical protein
MISARPLYQGLRRSVWDPETLAPRHVPRGAPSRRSGSVIGTDRWRSELPTRHAGHMAKRRMRVWYSPSCAGARAPRGGVTRQRRRPSLQNFPPPLSAPAPTGGGAGAGPSAAEVRAATRSGTSNAPRSRGALDALERVAAGPLDPTLCPLRSWPLGIYCTISRLQS